nr:VPg [Daphne virus Y]
GKNKMRRLKFRDARDKKMGREVYGDDGTIEHYFGSAYTKKGKQKGYTRAMGHKERRFSTFYGFDTDEVSFIRYLDPITGVTVDESPLTDIGLVQEHFEDIRQRLLEEGELEKQAIMHKPGIQGYCVTDGAKTVLKVDLTPHNPLLVQARVGTIAGFPDKEYVLRQTGPAVEIDRSALPKPSDGVVKYE